MHEKTESVSSKTGNFLTAIGVAILLILFGFFPFGWLGYGFLKAYYDETFIRVLFWIVFLAIIAFAITLIRFAMRSWGDTRKLMGIYSVLFGSLAILFAGLTQFYIFRVTVFEEAMMAFLVAFPARYGFPIIGLILGLLGFKSKWGKTGLLLVLVQFALLAMDYFPLGW